MNVISEHGFRTDGRRPNQIRNINCRLGVYQQAEGSAYIEQGNTKVLCAVYGPHEGKRSWQMEDRVVINCQYSSATFSGLERKNRPRGDRKSNECARLLEKAFESVVLTELFPRAQIDIFCEVIQADGSQLSACVNAASLALADAGIPMKGLVSAVTCTMVDGTSVVDITSREENDILPRLTIATVSGKDEVVLVELQNRVHIDNLSPLMSESKEVAASVHECLHAAIRNHLASSAALLMLQSLKMLGRPVLRRSVLMTTEAASSNDPWTSLVQEIQKTPIPARVVPKSLLQVVEEIDVVLKDPTASLSTDTFFSFLQSASTDQGLTLRRKCMELLQTRVNRENPELCVGSITYLLKTGEKEHKLTKEFLAQIQAAGNAGLLNSQMVLECLSQTNASELALPPKVIEIFTNVLLTECCEFNIAQLLQSFALVKLSGHPNLKEKLLQRARELVTQMNGAESIALLKYFCAQGLREQKIIGPTIHNITSQADPISINQIVTLAHAASFMKIYDARLLRKIAEDLNVEIIHLDWFAAVSLIDSFSRIRLDHKDLWTRLHNWVKGHMEDFRKLKMKQIALVAKSFASMNVQGSEDIAEVLLQTLQKPFALRNTPSQDAWLQAIHTLALFDQLPSNLGETVLNKNFIDALMKSSRNPHYKVASAQKLLQVQTSLLQKYGNLYKGPRISKETFGDVLSSQEAIQSILMAKYGSSSISCNEALFTHGLFLLAPKTHFEVNMIDNRGYFWNAAISLDQNKRFTPSATWTKETKLRPVILFDWKQRKKTLELGLGASSEESLLGEERMMLRHLRTDGLDPIVVFLSDLVRFNSQDDKNAFLKSLVVNK